jgi:hypothetical protein
MRHVVRQGECLVSIAAAYGTTVAALWNHPENEAIRSVRVAPNLLMAGDEVFVPTPAAGAQVRRGETHRFEGQRAMTRLRLKLIDVSYQGGEAREQPLANVAFRLEVGGTRRTGATDGEGVIDEPVPATSEAGALVLEPDSDHERTLALHIGHLDPLDEDSGALQRLSNLGFAADAPEAKGQALAAFQRKHGIEETHTIDDATRDKLRELEGR